MFERDFREAKWPFPQLYRSPYQIPNEAGKRQVTSDPGLTTGLTYTVETKAGGPHRAPPRLVRGFIGRVCDFAALQDFREDPVKL